MYNVLHLHSSSGLYGAESVIFNLGKTLETYGYHPIIGCIEVDNHHLSEFANAALSNGLDVELITTKVKFSPFAIYTIAKLIQKRAIKIINAHDYKATILGFFASRMTGIPLVETNHLFPPMPLNNKKLQLYSKIEVFFLRYADKTIAVSNKIQRALEVYGVPSKKICVINNGIDFDECQHVRCTARDTTRKELGFKKESFVIGGVGRLTEQKGFKYLLEAAVHVRAKNKDAVFIISGDGPLLEQLHTYMHKLQLNEHVKFLGFRKDILKILSTLDLFVMPSIDEGLPMAMLEAMAVGLPVIVTSVGEIPHVIQNEENGILVEPKNSKKLADKILHLAENDTLRKKVIDGGLQTVQNQHTKNSMSKKYTMVYKELLAET